jgi:hypothetical protein
MFKYKNKSMSFINILQNLQKHEYFLFNSQGFDSILVLIQTII